MSEVEKRAARRTPSGNQELLSHTFTIKESEFNLMTGLEHYQPRKWLSISSLIAFKRCPRRFFYSSGCRLSSSVPPAALKFGECIHLALPVAQTLGLAEAIQTFRVAWAENDEVYMDEKRNNRTAALMLADFYATFKESNGYHKGIYNLLDPTKVLRPDPTVQETFTIADRQSPYEIPFAIDIGLDVPLAGRIDGIATHRDTGEFWGVEYKTTSELSTRFLDSFTLSPQICAYTLALKTITAKNVRGCFVTGLLSSKTRNATMTQPVFVQDHHLQDFVVWARFVGHQILACEARGEFPKDFAGCNPYPQFASPGYQCDFQNLCLPEDWTVLKNMYTIREDKPFTLPTVNGKELSSNVPA